MTQPGSRILCLIAWAALLLPWVTCHAESGASVHAAAAHCPECPSHAPAEEDAPAPTHERIELPTLRPEPATVFVPGVAGTTLVSLALPLPCSRAAVAFEAAPALPACPRSVVLLL